MKSVCLLSGGIDSSTLLYYLYNRGDTIYPLAINYGQRHKRELSAASQIAKSLGLEIQEMDISNNEVLFKNNALTDNIDVPCQQYNDKSMAITVVGNRNMVFLSLAVAYAFSIQASIVAYAAHGGDHYLYPDCRPEFVEAMKKAIQLSTDKQVKLETPFINLSKASIVKEGLLLRVPYQYTWSCYQGESLACGECGTCLERLEAFAVNEVQDPIEYKKHKEEKHAIQ